MHVIKVRLGINFSVGFVRLGISARLLIDVPGRLEVIFGTQERYELV